MLKVLRICTALALIGCFTACEDIFSSGSSDEDFVGRELTTDENADSGGATEGDTTTGDGGTDTDAPVTQSSTQVPADLAGVRWLHTNVSGWSQTASLDARVSGSSMVLSYNKANVWPSRVVDGTAVNANPWIFVFRDGVWYAATWEWLRPGQTSKAITSVAGDHIKKSPLNSFSPRSGEVYGFMVSGLARDSTRNVQERSNVDMVRWP